jgi:hypothetical protein
MGGFLAGGKLPSRFQGLSFLFLVDLLRSFGLPTSLQDEGISREHRFTRCTNSLRVEHNSSTSRPRVPSYKHKPQPQLSIVPHTASSSQSTSSINTILSSSPIVCQFSV